MKKQFVISLIILSLFATSCRKESNAPEAVITDPEAPKPIAPPAKLYEVDTIASAIQWMGSKPTGSHSGTIGLSKGEIFVKSDSVATGKFTINMKSITVTDPKEGKDKVNLENHVKGLGDKMNEDHFFNVNKYPTGYFEITGLTNKIVKPWLKVT